MWEFPCIQELSVSWPFHELFYPNHCLLCLSMFLSTFFLLISTEGWKCDFFVRHDEHQTNIMQIACWFNLVVFCKPILGWPWNCAIYARRTGCYSCIHSSRVFFGFCKPITDAIHQLDTHTSHAISSYHPSSSTLHRHIVMLSVPIIQHRLTSSTEMSTNTPACTAGTHAL